MATLGFPLAGPLGGDIPTTIVPVEPTVVLAPAAAQHVIALPRDLALNADGDLDLSSGDLQLTTEKVAIAQALDIAFGMVKGEWFLDLDEGFDLYGTVLTDNPNETLILEEARRVALSVEGVTSVKTLELDLDRVGREADLFVVCGSDFGDIEQDVRLGGAAA